MYKLLGIEISIPLSLLRKISLKIHLEIMVYKIFLTLQRMFIIAKNFTYWPEIQKIHNGSIK